MKVLYEAIVTDLGDAWEARFPDLAITTQGESMVDVASSAQDLLENYVVVALQEGKELPKPTLRNDCTAMEYRLCVLASCDEDTPQEETMSVNEAADILDVTPTRIRAMICDGVLRAQKVGRVYMVRAEDVMARFNEPVAPGRPKLAEA